MANPGEVLRQAARGRERLLQETRASMVRDARPQAAGSSIEDGMNRGWVPADMGAQAVEPAGRGMQSARNAARDARPQAAGSSAEDGMNRGWMPADMGAQAVEPVARGMQSAQNVARETQTSLRASHANYSALMRSHDRVRTCHLNPH